MLFGEQVSNKMTRTEMSLHNSVIWLHFVFYVEFYLPYYLSIYYLSIYLYLYLFSGVNRTIYLTLYCTAGKDEKE